MKIILALGLCLILHVFSASAENKETLLVATNIEPPYSYFVDNKYTGINVKIITLLAEKLNLQVKFLHCPFARCLSFLEMGQADAIIGLRKTAERSKFLTYLDQPFSTQTFPLQFYIRQDSDLNITNYSDLANLRIGTLRAATYFDRFDHDNTLNKVEVVNYNQLLQMLLKDRIDTFLEREESVKPWIDNAEYKQKIKLADYLYNRSVDSYIAFSKKSPFSQEVALFSQMQKQLLDSGEIQAIRNNK
ncbi:transporter substrate-binding domain-containing protein [Colwellia sp. 1_MG-2023]|uniref:substrate-binding periplasmic protein n=1 Tax=Colwellia sp. 1_MG-2023 TaxID=3062649 RepID=UPI0026E40972|nr:transporter substrate-binding domain-containing protein [Colwellia sp. 1_MG-2023]MDO6444629.1 transporter substrate-binding domain-containing protein [Colwellia sp. 1_MG-2023]